jgi:uncharacterized membrane protein YcaP (DUF421 family)
MMNLIFCKIDWDKMLRVDTPLLEIFVRGSVMYLSIYFLLRFVLKRQAGSLGIADVLVLVLIADAAQNAMADDYTSLPDGILLVSTIVFWSYTLDWLGYRFSLIDRILNPRPLKLVKNGRVIREHLKKEFISEEELISQLRQHGIADVAKVKEAFIESDGHISVITQEEQKPANFVDKERI